MGIHSWDGTDPVAGSFSFQRRGDIGDVEQLRNMNTLWHLSEGFGFNTNVLETNVLNLAVVLGVVVVFGGDALTALLDARRERIVQSVESAEERFKEAQQRIADARAQLVDAETKAETIRSQGSASVQQAKTLLVTRAEEELARLEETKAATLQLAEQKATKQVQKQLATLALEKASTKLKQKLQSASVQKELASFQIVAFTKSTLPAYR